MLACVKYVNCCVNYSVNKMFRQVNMITTLLLKAFAKYDLEVPLDVCALVREYLRDVPYLSCRYCNINLLSMCVTRPFVSGVPRYYKVYYNNVYTVSGMMTRVNAQTNSQTIQNLEADVCVDLREGILTVEQTPEVLNMCGTVVRNEVIKYKQCCWYKSLYSENDDCFIYVCSDCFLFIKRIRRAFDKWRYSDFRIVF